MSNFLNIFLIFLLIGFINISTSDSVCKLKNDCSCELNDGTGINMLSINSSLLLAYLPNLTYIFSPCQDTTTLPQLISSNKNKILDNCTTDSGYSLCIYNETDKSLTKLMKTIDWQFGFHRNNETLFMNYQQNNMSISLELVCVSSATTSNLFAYNDNLYNLVLYSPYACLHQFHQSDQLSTGSVLTIIVAVSFLAYVMLGSVVNYFLLGARGVEVFPNLSFWKNLPGLVVDGAKFLQNGCKVRPSGLVEGRESYDSI